MPDDCALPPSTPCRFSVWGWLAAAASLLLGATSLYFDWSFVYLCWGIVVGVGFIAAIPRDMFYHYDVREYLAKHRELSSSELPWPAEYAQLSCRQAWKYSTRHLRWTILYAILIPAVMVMVALIRLRIFGPNAVIEHLLRTTDLK